MAITKSKEEKGTKKFIYKFDYEHIRNGILRRNICFIALDADVKDQNIDCQIMLEKVTDYIAKKAQAIEVSVTGYEFVKTIFIFEEYKN